jgi:transposase
MSATHATQPTAPQSPVLYMALELSLASWKLAFTVGSGHKPRIRSVSAGELSCLLDEIKLARKRFGLPEGATSISCYEAGRDGFWIHRFLINEGIKNIVVDSASIEVTPGSGPRP